MNVSRIQNLIVNIGKGIPKHRSSMFQRRNSLNDMTVQILVVVLGEVHEISGSVVVDRHVYAR